MPKYLTKRRRGWYAVLEVPDNLRKKVGKVRFFQSLQTESLTEAERKVHAVVGEWKELLEQYRTGQAPSDSLKAMRHHRAILQSKGVPDHEIRMAHEELATESDELSEAAYIVHGGGILLVEQVEPYLATLSLEQKTIDMKRSDINRLLKKFKFADDITKRSVVEWVETELIGKEGLTLVTCRRIISTYRGFWEHIMRSQQNEVPSPFEGVVPAKSKKKAKEDLKSARKPFTVADYKRLMVGLEKKDLPLANLIQIAAHTGARIEEICSLKVSDVTDKEIKIKETKTVAGVRNIPIHSNIASLVDTLKKSSTDGYLLSNLPTNKYGDRSDAIGKRFGRLKTSLEYGSDYVFHSFRKSVATQLETALVPENISARILGHDLKTMTYGLYSGGIAYDVAKDAIEKIRWK